MKRNQLPVDFHERRTPRLQPLRKAFQKWQLPGKIKEALDCPFAMHSENEQSKYEEYRSRHNQNWCLNGSGREYEKSDDYARQKHEQVCLDMHQAVVLNGSSRVPRSHPL